MKKLSKRLEERIEKALEHIRPYLEEDGGDVKIIGITSEQVLKLQLLGNCQSCPMSQMTLKAGIEDVVKRAFPEILAVEAIDMASPDIVIRS